MPAPLRLALALALLPALAAAQGIEVEGARAGAPRDGAAMGAAYMTIRNAGEAPDRLLGAATPAAARAEIHRSVEDEGGVVRMEEAEGGLELPPGGELVLEQGGVHLMLMGLSPDFVDGATIPLVLTFEAAGEVALDVPVAIGMGDGDGHGGHGGHGEGG